MEDEGTKLNIAIGGSWMERHFRRGIGAKVTVLVLGLVAVFLVVGIIVFMGLKQTAAGIAKVQDIFDTAEKVTALNAQTDELKKEIAEIAAQPQGASFEPLYANIASQKQTVAEARTTFARQSEAVAVADEMMTILDECETILHDELAPAAAAGDMAAMEAARGKIDGFHVREMEGTVSLLVATQDEIAFKRSQNVSMLSRSRLALGVGLVIAGVGGLLAGFVVSGRISRRLKRLGWGVDEIRHGNLAHRVDVSGNDEVADLSRSFNEMAAELEGRTVELQREQNHIRSVHQGIADGIIVFDRVGRVLSVNPAAEVFVGRNEEELAGRWNMGIEEIEEIISLPELVPDDMKLRCREVLDCQEKDCPAYASAESRCWLIKDTLCQGEVRRGFAEKRTLCERCPVFVRNYTRMTGFSVGSKHYSVSASPVLDDQGTEQGRLAVIHDVTEMRANELATLKRNRELALLNKISTYISRSTGDLDRVFDETLQAVLQEMGARTGAILLLGKDGKYMEIKSGKGIPGEMMAYLRSVSLVSDLMELADDEGAFINLEALFAEKPEMRNSLEQEGLKLPVVALLWGEEGAIGLMAVADARKNIYTSDEIQLLRSVASQLGVAIRNLELISGIKKAKKEWEVTFDAMTDGVAILDRELNIIRANYSMAAMLQSSLSQIIGERGHAIYPEDTASEIISLQHHVIDKRHRAVTEIMFDRGSRVLRLAFDPVVDSNGQVIGLVNIVSDITEQKQLREQLLQSEKMAAMGQLVAGVAHELNNPLTGIIGYAELLLRRGATANGDTGKDLRAIRGEAERASRIVHNLLSFARKQPAQKSYANINRAVSTVVELRRYELNLNNIILEMELDEHLSRTMIDLHQVEQILLNIINNAEHAIMGKGEGGTIRVGTQTTGSGIVLTVEDDGPGVGADVITQIFNPFFTTKEVGKGTGLGLSICYGIVKDHGGDIRVESVEGQGARFVIEFPLTEPPVTLVKDDQAAGGRLSRRVLVVDDEPAIVELLTDILTMEGHGVDVADNGEAALLKMNEVKYDSVITDIKMPEMDGRELHRQICRIDPGLAERVIFITGDTVSQDTWRFISSTGNSCLVKPFDLEELRKELQRMLNHNGN